MMISKSSPTKSRRRTKRDIEGIEAMVVGLLADESPMTVRQIFYQLVTRGVIGKTESEYKNTVCRVLANMRRRGDIPFSLIADNTRWMRKPRTYSSLRNMLDHTRQTYRRAIWDELPVYVEVWLEKEALAGVLFEETEKWDVPLMVCRGYPSLSFVASAAETIADQAKPAHIYYFGDYDPSGVDIPRFVEQSLNEMFDMRGESVDLSLHVVAVRQSQIEELQLPTRPTKASDSRSKAFGAESVEVDAIPPSVLRSMAEDCITQHIDFDCLRRLMLVEQSERDTLAMMAAGLGEDE